MKKIIMIVTLILSMFLIVSCNGKPDPNESTPKILGVENSVVEQGSIFNILAGITATDEVDGNITNKIIVTGNVDTNELGEYTLTYTVTNSFGNSDQKERIVEVVKRKTEEEVFTYYEPTKLNRENTIYVLNSPGVEELSNDDSFTAQVIQGLFARDEVRFYFNGRSITNLVNTDQYHLDQTVERYNLKTENITLIDAINMYIDAWDSYILNNMWGSNISLEEFNIYPNVKAYTEKEIEGELAGYATPGYIVYRKGTVSVNVAATLAGITGFLPIELGSVEFAKSLGLVEKFNVDNILFGYNWIFSTALSEINPDGLIHQDYQSSGGITNKFIKDYGVMQKYMHVYYDSNVNAPQSFRQNLHRFLTPNRPILGYTYSEDNDVAFYSNYGQFITPTDYSFNLTYLTADLFRQDEDGEQIVFKQPNKDETEVSPNTHYVAFIVSDGDNATMWQNTSLFAGTFMNAFGRENDTFPITWSITPSMADLMPSILYSAYHERSNGYDYFAAPVSGHGYINAGGFIKAGDGAYMDDYLSKLDIYMKKADLSITTIIGTRGLENRVEVINEYASLPSVKGGIVYEGSKYFGAVPGSIYWSNNKPFIGPRDSLWETTPEYIAARLNLYPKDPTSIDGYSLINVHPWSHSYEDVRTIVNMLDSNVKVVSVDRLFELMTENIVDKTNDDGFKTPAQNGMSVTKEYLEQNPSLIPVNPLFNDFLLWEEDWSAVSGSVSSSNHDNANSNVGTFHTSLVIGGNTIAEKAALKLPNIDDLWISFMARGNSNNSLEEATFKFTLEIDGVEKTILEAVKLKGVSGTETEQSIKGDGWQAFAFPISQYFGEYKNKTAKIKIETTSAIGIKVDKFLITQRLATPSGEYDRYNNQFLSGNTEDWLLGHQYKTSQYAYWGALNKDNGKPFETGAIQIDVSDGGGNEKRNANTNLWMAKNVILPDSDTISLTWKLEGNPSEPLYGVKYKISLYVDGKYFVIQDWNRANGAQELKNINITELTGLQLKNKEVTIMIEVRDSGTNNGVGEVAWFRSFGIVYS